MHATKKSVLYFKHGMLKETFDMLGREFEPTISQFCAISVCGIHHQLFESLKKSQVSAALAILP